MEMFHIIDVISILGLPSPPNGRSSYYIQCPCCDELPRNKHLNINLKKDVYRCPRCGISGGIFDLYSLYTGVPRDKVRKTLVKSLGLPMHLNTERKKYTSTPVVDCPITDIEARNATYTALLSKLSLAGDHKQNLFDRGLSDDDIIRLGYKTTPIVGMSVLAKQLQNEGYYLAGVPGFYKTDNGDWTFVQEKRGILIPVRDIKGRIQGLQIRRDDVQKRKFRWVSSADKTDGCRAESWTHLVGPIRPIALLTVIVIDINGLKEINDGFGHFCGDDAIKTVAKALRETIGAKADIYRIGGDEFVCISESNILPYISQFRDTVSFLNNEKLYKLSVSVGYASYNEKYSKTIDDMILYADEKMYKDKKRKK